ncbi:unnamed protein product, partial [Discosporangium mesarthrocarpum]
MGVTAEPATPLRGNNVLSPVRRGGSRLSLGARTSFSSPVWTPNNGGGGGLVLSGRRGAPSPISSRDASEAAANRRLSGQHADYILANQRQLEGVAANDDAGGDLEK